MDLRKTLFVLPNLITLASIFCGFNAILIVARDNPGPDNFYRAAVLLIFAMLFDLLDGRVARMTRTQSAFGLQLDSLADLTSFGVAPALLIYKWVLFRHPIPGFLTAFLFVACGAIRLARFNVLSSGPGAKPSRPPRHIVGLPIPPAAGVLISLVVANRAVGGALSDTRYTVVLFGVTILVSLLMVSTVKFRSLKDLKLDTGTMLLVLFVIGSSIFVWRRFNPQFVLVWLLSFYVLIGLLETVRELGRRLHRARSPQSVPPSGDAPSPTVD